MKAVAWIVVALRSGRSAPCGCGSSNLPFGTTIFLLADIRGGSGDQPPGNVRRQSHDG